MEMVSCWKCGTELREDASFCHKCGASVKPVATGERTGFELLSDDKTVQDHYAKRVIAFILDSVIVSVVVAVLALVLAIPFLLGLGFTPGFPSVYPAWWGFWLGGLIPLAILGYFTLAEWLYGRTIGKKIMGLKVARKDGRPMDLWTSFVRNISKFNFVLLILDVAAGLAMRGDTSQKFSDRYAGTVVETVSKLTLIS